MAVSISSRSLSSVIYKSFSHSSNFFPQSTRFYRFFSSDIDKHSPHYFKSWEHDEYPELRNVPYWIDTYDFEDKIDSKKKLELYDQYCHHLLRTYDDYEDNRYKMTLPMQRFLGYPPHKLRLDRPDPYSYKDIPHRIEWDNEMKQTILGNQLQVISEENPSAISTIGIAIRAGSRYENEELKGCTQYYDRMAFKSTEKRSTIQQIMEIQRIGARMNVHSSRENILMYLNVSRNYLQESISLLSDCIRCPVFLPWEIEDEREPLKQALMEKMLNMEVVMMEGLHLAAYGNQSLGRPLSLSLDLIEHVSSTSLTTYHQRFFQPHRICLLGVAVDHDLLVEMGQNFFGSMISNSELEKAHLIEPIQYRGGYLHLSATPLDGLFHVALAYDPGPGKGMYSRLNLNVLNRYQYVERCTSFAYPSNEAALFGIYATCLPSNANDIYSIIQHEIQDMLNQFTKDEMHRAKNLFKSSILFNLENRNIIFEDTAAQYLAYGKRYRPEQLIEMINEISNDDIHNLIQRGFKRPPTIVTAGDTTSFNIIQ